MAVRIDEAPGIAGGACGGVAVLSFGDGMRAALTRAGGKFGYG